MINYERLQQTSDSSFQFEAHHSFLICSGTILSSSIFPVLFIYTLSPDANLPLFNPIALIEVLDIQLMPNINIFAVSLMSVAGFWCTSIPPYIRLGCSLTRLRRDIRMTILGDSNLRARERERGLNTNFAGELLREMFPWVPCGPIGPSHWCSHAAPWTIPWASPHGGTMVRCGVALKCIL